MGKNPDIYTIIDVSNYALQMRQEAAKSIADTENDNLDDYITLDQVIKLINDNCLGFDEKNRPQLNEKINIKIFEEIAIWIHNFGLAKLAGDDLVECAWDDKSNEMIFWKKDA